MNPDFWRARWREGRIGFHEGHPNAQLEKHIDVFQGAATLLVPFCGKAADLAFLASKGHQVIGIEVVEEAVQAFFQEHGLTPERHEGKRFTDYRAGSIRILAGDFFSITAADLGPVQGFYDRAAMIALPASTRPQYVQHLKSLLEPASVGLVINFEYDQTLMNGPPFSVSEDEVRTLYVGSKVLPLERIQASNERLKSLNAPGSVVCFEVDLVPGGSGD